MITTGLFTSNTDMWSTPPELYKILDDEFHFTLDVCATPENARCNRFFTEKEDGLVQDWLGEVCWMNPPYGRTIAAWLEKAVKTMLGGGCVVCLIPSRTDTRWWHEYVMKYATGIRLIRGRLKFGESLNAAPFPSAIAIFDGRPKCWFSIR